MHTQIHIIRAHHCQQCNDTTCNLLLSFWRKKNCKHGFCRLIPLTRSTLLSSAVRQKLFFSKCAHLRDASSQALLTIYHKKIATVMCTDLRPQFFTPRRTASSAPSHFFSKFRFGQLRKQNATLQTAMDKMHTMDSLL